MNGPPLLTPDIYPAPRLAPHSSPGPGGPAPLLPCCPCPHIRTPFEAPSSRRSQSSFCTWTGRGPGRKLGPLLVFEVLYAPSRVVTTWPQGARPQVCGVWFQEALDEQITSGYFAAETSKAPVERCGFGVVYAARSPTLWEQPTPTPYLRPPACRDPVALPHDLTSTATLLGTPPPAVACPQNRARVLAFFCDFSAAFPLSPGKAGPLSPLSPLCPQGRMVPDTRQVF